MRIQQSHSSSSNSNDSSISSISSTSSDSDYNMTSGIGDLEADADSLISRQSGLSSNDQFDNDGHKLVKLNFCILDISFYLLGFIYASCALVEYSEHVSKRPRTGIEESSFGATVTNTDMEGCKSEYSSVRNSSVTAIVTNDQVGSHWDWDDENSGVGMDILLSEFGEFGDFFENDTLPFGEVHSFSM
ncbi:hypothetical protein GIB67_015207 [Kingdonia uniflora]|uniref:Mediator of RNA polymerase II transcription subunit 13 n=1 Tax=Kingdonia uniflora TaxID=39325 RepID=A0A7J7MSJ7_9MAGN|nr:hypothetical protein GIB67_015207 [Kingdonia uniflora]